jgi:hypothetical protein
MRIYTYIFFSSVLFLKGFSSCSQTSYGIKKINAFYIEKLPGNIPVDENGNSLFKGPDTLITIYVEISGKGPEWKTAWWSGKNYSITSSLISQTPYEAGTNARDDKKIILNPAKGNKLWRLDLQVCEKKISQPQKIKPGQVLLSGKYLNKTIFRKIDSIIQLTTFPSV